MNVTWLLVSVGPNSCSRGFLLSRSEQQPLIYPRQARSLGTRLSQINARGESRNGNTLVVLFEFLGLALLAVAPL